MRFEPWYAGVRDARDRVAALRSMSDEQVVGALAAANGLEDSVLVNVLATEAMNRVRRANAVASSIGVGVILSRPDLCVTYVNPHAARLLEAAPHHLLGRQLDEALRPVNPHGAPLSFLEIIGEGNVVPGLLVEAHDVAFTSASGGRLPVVAKVSVAGADDCEAIVLAFCEDPRAALAPR